MKQRLHCLTLATCCTLPSAGCTSGEAPEQLRVQAGVVRQEPVAPAPPLIATQAFTPLAYDLDGNDTPFGQIAETADDTDSRPAQRGPKQYLEEFPLDAIRLVGTIARKGETEALMQVEKIVYRTRAGDYLGQNFGVIRRVGDNEVELEELVRSGNNGWEKRMTTIALRGAG